jgi:hypothetical protein
MSPFLIVAGAGFIKAVCCGSRFLRDGMNGSLYVEDGGILW